MPATIAAAHHSPLHVNAHDNQGCTPLILACSMEHWPSELDRNSSIVSKLLQREGVDVNRRDKKGRTALYVAIADGRMEVVLELLKHGELDVNDRGAHGNTALIWATLWGRLDVVCGLLDDDRVDVSVRNKAGSTALGIARKCELFEIARRLEEHSKVCQHRQWKAKLPWQDEELKSRERKRRRLSD